MREATEEGSVFLCLKSFLRENKKYLADSKTVISVMHKFGLASRDLGSLHRRAQTEEAHHVRIILERVALVKTLKNLFRQVLRRSEVGDHGQLIARLLNCVFCN
jgi:hypothetical protein